MIFPSKRTLAVLWTAAQVLIIVVLLVVASALWYYYDHFNGIIEARLQNNPHTNSVFSRPYVLTRDKAVTVEELVEELEAAGYQKKLEDLGTRTGHWYRQEEDTFLIGHLDASATSTVYEVQIEKNRVASLSLEETPVESLELKPAFLSNIFGKTREKRKYVSYESIPPVLVQAVLAAEDGNFFNHKGLDIPSLIRAARINLTRWEPAQGGSTITQQFIKNYFLTPEKHLRRKMEEAYLALIVENRFSKEEIFEFYANELYLGQLGSFAMVGLAQSAEGYFGKEMQDLSLAEAALLAGIIQAPNRLSPYRDVEAAQARRNHILDLMAQREFITPEEAGAAKEDPIELASSAGHLYTEAPYFIDYLTEYFRREVPDWQSSENFQVYSSLDPKLQDAAIDILRKETVKVNKQISRRNRGLETEAALIAVDPRTGEILAMVGGLDYARTQFNRVTNALRQPGSTFKPFVFATALESGIHNSPPLTLSSVIQDAPYTFVFNRQEYSPTNFGHRYHGNVTLRRALALSLNVPAVKVAEEIGYQKIADFAKSLGFREELEAFPSLALGTWEVTLLEMAQAYTVFANQGKLTRLRPASRYVRDGEEVMLSTELTQALSPQVAFLMTSAMQSVIDWGTGAKARSAGFRAPAAGKTGSSHDSWFIGYTPDLLCAVWVGIDDFTSLGMTGAEAALPIWSQFMRRAQQLGWISGQRFEVPEGLTTAQIDPASGLRAISDCPRTVTEYYLPGTQPTSWCYLDHYEDWEVTSPDDDLTENDGEEQEQKKAGGFWRRVFGR
jgi:penicillin-binding protein 1B